MVWLVDRLFYWMNKGYLDSVVSAANLKGGTKTSNKGLCDVLLFKLALNRQTLPE